MSKLPFELHHTHTIIDSSKSKTYLDCPRQFFYQYVLGWQPEGARHALEFGEAWHQGMEVLLQEGYSPENVEHAMVRFLQHYRKSFSAETDMLHAPKNPGNAMVAYLSYIRQYADDLDRFEILYTEIAGAVPLTKDYNIHFRLDTLMRDKQSGDYLFLEHKSASRAGRQWFDQWPLSVQVGTYCHVLYCLYGPASYGGYINGTVFQKKGIEHVRVPVKKGVEAMQVWHWNMVDLFDRIHRDYERLLQCSPDDNIMQAFPQNPESCTKYFGCPFHDFCISWANPLWRCSSPPMGFKQEFWNPAEREATTKLNF